MVTSFNNIQFNSLNMAADTPEILILWYTILIKEISIIFTDQMSNNFILKISFYAGIKFSTLYHKILQSLRMKRQNLKQT